jgi:membrane-associated phospholipid phosphatase
LTARGSRTLSLVLAICLTSASAGAVAELQPERRWQYARFDWLDLGVSAAGVSVIVAATLLWPPRGEIRWRGPILVDTPVREGLRAESREGRDSARLVGDLLYLTGALYPSIVDGLIVTLGLRDEPDIAAQMLLVNLQSYAVAGAVLTGSERLFARARPSVEPCQTDPQYERFCGEPDQASSMISGHTGVVATSAGLLCAHHQHLGLYGSAAADLSACVGGIALAVGTGMARTVNDRHYATDVFAAFVVGGLAGYVLPVLRFYGRPEPATGVAAWTIVPAATRVSAGASLIGVF